MTDLEEYISDDVKFSRYVRKTLKDFFEGYCKLTNIELLHTTEGYILNNHGMKKCINTLIFHKIFNSNELTNCILKEFNILIPVTVINKIVEEFKRG